MIRRILGLAALLALSISIASGQNQSSRAHEDAFYRAHISQNLGLGYLAEYDNLTRVNYRYDPKTAQYMVHAFANGFKYGYVLGSKQRQYFDSGYYNSYAQQLQQEANTWYSSLLSHIQSWQGLASPGWLSNRERIFYAGWRSGWERGYREKGSVAPQPTDIDFRAYWSPPGAIDPAYDPWGDLRNR